MKLWILTSYKNLDRVTLDFERYLSAEINWKNRLIVIIGARGVGKTTLMMQHIKKNISNTTEVLYASLDNLYFSKSTIIDLAETFTQVGGKYLFLDEIQKYKNWSIEIKNIYDNFPELQLVLSGSSTTEILRAEGDLSRRALFYRLHGLSFREFLNFNGGHHFDTITLSDVLSRSNDFALEITQKIHPIKEFTNYLEYGYYPFFKEDLLGYHQRIGQVINTVLENDIPAVYPIDYAAVQKIKKMLRIISELVPFKPNITKLSQEIGISRESFIRYLQYLEKAELILSLYSSTKGISLLAKPEKIYLNNTNIAYALANTMNIGNARETFFANQLTLNHDIKQAVKGDFLVDGKYTFEVGGKNKTFKQIQDMDHSWIAMDNIEVAVGNKIPLWLFGFLY